LARSHKDDEEAARVRKEQDELLQKDAISRQWILDLLGEVERERDLKVKAEERFSAQEMKVSQDTAMVERLGKERDGLSQTAERLRSERGTTCEECD